MSIKFHRSVNLLSVCNSLSQMFHLRQEVFLLNIWSYGNLDFCGGIRSSAEETCTYLLTYSMVQSPYWEAKGFAANQEIPRISWNPKVHYRPHKRPSPVSILGQPNPVHKSTSHLLEIHPNIIHPSMPSSSQWFYFLPVSKPWPYTPHILTHTSHVPNPSHSSLFYHSQNIGWGVQII